MANMFVKAGMAAKAPPLAFVPQIVMAIIREPRSRAGFAHTRNRDMSDLRNRCDTITAELTSNRRKAPDDHTAVGVLVCFLSSLRNTTYYTKPRIHGTAAGGAMKLVGSRHAHTVTPITKSYCRWH